MNRLLRLTILVISTAFIPILSQGQCATNIGFESGNFTGWNRATDSNFITPASRRYIVPGVNMGVINYGGTDMYLGTINRANVTVGNKLIKVGNRTVNATADTVYRTYIVDSLSDKLTIYSKGVVELAHNYWNVATVEAPGFGYEIYVNGRKLDCLKGAFFCGNVDTPHVWQLGTYKDTAGVRKSTGWGAETLNFACFVGDTIEVRLFTRDCILLGHYAYAYFDVVCGDTNKPVISQIEVNDIIRDDQLDLYCTQNATLYLEPNSDICPMFMGNIQWTPQSYIIGSKTVDSALLQVPDSVWIYASAEFSNYCQTIDVFDSIYVKYWAFDPHDNVPKIDKNFCNCSTPDTIDFTGLNVTTIYDAVPNIYNLTVDKKLIVNPCDNYYYTGYWKSQSSRVVTNISQIGASPWVSGNSDGAIGYDSLSGAGWVKLTIDVAAGKSFYVGIQNTNVNNNHDMDHSIYVNGTNITSYYNGGSSSNHGAYSGTVTVEFEVLSTRRVRLWINGVLVRSYTSSQRIPNFPYFVDYSANSNNTNHIRTVELKGPFTNAKDFNKLVNRSTFKYFMTYADRCGVTVNDTISYTPGFTSNMGPDIIQCGRDLMNLRVSSTSYIDRISWSTDGTGVFQSPSNNGSLNSQNVNLGYTPSTGDYARIPVSVIITSTSGTCQDKDTILLTVRENPVANAGPDISTTLDTFAIGGTPPGSCSTCGGINFDWSQGNALTDSTIGNPLAIKVRIGPPMFVLKVINPSTGCFDLDTTYIYTSLPIENNHVEAKCITGNIIEFNWMSLPNQSIDHYAIEYSVDGGNSWNTSRTIKSFSSTGNVAMPYNISINRNDNSNTIYRWSAINVKGDRLFVENLDAISCSDMPVYDLYPNPFTNNLELSIYSEEGTKRQYTFEIYNQYGQIVFNKEVTYDESGNSKLIALDGLNNLNTGVYHFNVMSNGKSLYKTLIVKSN